MKTWYISSGNGEMKTAQRILFAARHAFLKHGYISTSLKKIAEFSDTRPQSIRYHFGSKERIFKIIFPDYIDLLIAQLRNEDSHLSEEDFQKRKIQYPDVFEVAWFVANEFHSNSERVYRIIKENPGPLSELHLIYENSRLRENFEKLIRVNVSMIMQRNMLRLG